MVGGADLNFEYPGSEHPKQAVRDISPYALAAQAYAPQRSTIWDGEKFPGGFGVTELQTFDYYTMRQRSAQVFNTNIYARGLIRRLITNEVNTGLTPEATPQNEILLQSEEFLNNWTERTETRFALWANSPKLCDYRGIDNFGALQRYIRRESFVEGDVLIVLRQSQRYKLPQVQIVPGSKVVNPIDETIRKGHTVNMGVEKNARGLIVAYWVLQDDGTTKRIPVYGEKSGRKISWLVYGSDKRIHDDRGVPFLALMLQSARELDRFRDGVQRKMLINSILALFIEKTENKPSSTPFSTGAARKDSVNVTDGDGGARRFDIANQLPGMVIEELQVGEKPTGFQNQGADLNFPEFESAIVSTLAWAYEIPPEILKLSFSNNYSASQAAINEFKIYLNLYWSAAGASVCRDIYIEWLLSEVLLRKIAAPGLLESWRDPEKYDIFEAWVSVEWYGSIKPSTDIVKQAKGSKLLVDEGWSTNAREARVTTGTKYSTNIKRLKRENELKVEAMRPLLDMQKEINDLKNQSNTGGANAALMDEIQAVHDAIEDLTQ